MSMSTFRPSAPEFIKYAVLSGLVTACICVPRLARADTAIAADLDFNLPVMASWAAKGGGFGIRLGQQMSLPAIVLTPEIGFTYASFAVGKDNIADKGPNAYRGYAGLRLGVGEILRPGIFAHVGIGRLTGYADVESQKHTALTWDAGAFFDFTLIPLINIGAHAAFDQITGSSGVSSFKWVQLGLHAALIL